MRKDAFSRKKYNRLKTISNIAFLDYLLKYLSIQLFNNKNNNIFSKITIILKYDFGILE